jgi:hypothetical protein
MFRFFLLCSLSGFGLQNYATLVQLVCSDSNEVPARVLWTGPCNVSFIVSTPLACPGYSPPPPPAPQRNTCGGQFGSSYINLTNLAFQDTVGVWDWQTSVLFNPCVAVRLSPACDASAIDGRGAAACLLSPQRAVIVATPPSNPEQIEFFPMDPSLPGMGVAFTLESATW